MSKDKGGMMERWHYGWSHPKYPRRGWNNINRGEWRREIWEGSASQGPPVVLSKHRDCLYPWRQPWVEWDGEELDEVGAGSTEKQGHSAFLSLLPFRDLASTKGCYVTAIYTRTPLPSHPSLSRQAAPHANQMQLHSLSSPFPLFRCPFLPTVFKSATNLNESTAWILLLFYNKGKTNPECTFPLETNSVPC